MKKKTAAAMAIAVAAGGAFWALSGAKKDPAGAGPEVPVAKWPDTAMVPPSTPNAAEEPGKSSVEAEPPVKNTTKIASKKRGSSMLDGAGRLSASTAAALRFSFLRSITREYRSVLEKLNLSQEEEELLLDLLVDQRMSGFEARQLTGAATTPGPSTAAQIEEVIIYNNSLMKELLGDEKYQTLKDYESARPAISQADEAVAALQKSPGGLNADAADAVYSKVAEFDFGTAIPEHIASAKALTAQDEQAIRSDLSQKFTRLKAELSGSLSATELQALESWFNSKVNGDIAFARSILKAISKEK